MNRILATAVAASLLACAGNASALGALTDITIYDRTERRSLPVYQHNGRHYVVGTPGNEYQVRVRNQTGGDVLTVISVDGVNVVSGETAHWNQTGYVLDAWRGMDIKGWRKSMGRTAAFYFTRLPDSYAARTGRPDNVGVIGVAVFQRKPQLRSDPLPLEQEDESASSAAPFGSARAPAPPARAEGSTETKSRELTDGRRDANRKAERQRLGTGHGRSETSYVRYTTFERATETPAEIIRIYYDSYANLVAQGVIPVRHDYEPLAATPFPAQFVPDPPR